MLYEVITAVISDRTRKEVFGNGDVLGQYLETTNGTFRIIGVVPIEEIDGDNVGADVWVPITQSTLTTEREEPYGSVITSYSIHYTKLYDGENGTVTL